MGDTDWRQLLVVGALTGIIGLLIFAAFQASFKWAFLPLLSVFLIVIDFIRHWGTFDSIPLRLKPRFICISGAMGRIVRGPEASHSNMISYWVAFPKPDIPRNKLYLKDRTWMDILLDTFAGVKTIRVTNNYNMFQPIPQNNLEVEEGAIMYMARLDNGPTQSLYTIVTEELKKYSMIVAELGTVNRAMEVMTANLARMKTHEMDQMSQDLQMIADRVKRVQVIAKGSGQQIVTENMGDEV